jgi:hypothetical protein
MSAKSTKITKKKIDLPEEVVEKNDEILHLNRVSKIFLGFLVVWGIKMISHNWFVLF